MRVRLLGLPVDDDKPQVPHGHSAAHPLLSHRQDHFRAPGSRVHGSHGPCAVQGAQQAYGSGNQNLLCKFSQVGISEDVPLLFVRASFIALGQLQNIGAFFCAVTFIVPSIMQSLPAPF